MEYASGKDARVEGGAGDTSDTGPAGQRVALVQCVKGGCHTLSDRGAGATTADRGAIAATAPPAGRPDL
jgi:hypothetical protein